MPGVHQNPWDRSDVEECKERVESLGIPGVISDSFRVWPEVEGNARGQISTFGAKEGWQKQRGRK